MTGGIRYGDIVKYLEGIANNKNNKRNVDKANHGRFWNTMTRDQFVKGSVPGEDCNGSPVPIADADSTKCALYQALTNATGICLLGQMPRQGPYITDKDYSVTLSDGTTISGADIAANIKWWLENNMPA